MSFSAGQISLTDIQNELAYNNTSGPQTPVNFSDTAVRAAANKPSGAISYSDLHGVNVFYSGTFTFGYVRAGPNEEIYGYLPDFPTTGLSVGVKYTTPYFKDNADLSYFIFDFRYNNLNSACIIAFSDIPSPPTNLISTMYVTIGGVRYVVTNINAANPSMFQFTGDVFDLIGKVGTTQSVVITY